jgi:hypothetical protein
MCVGKWGLEARLLDGLVGSRSRQPTEASRVRDALVAPPVRQASREIEVIDLRDDWRVFSATLLPALFLLFRLGCMLGHAGLAAVGQVRGVLSEAGAHLALALLDVGAELGDLGLARGPVFAC